MPPSDLRGSGPTRPAPQPRHNVRPNQTPASRVTSIPKVTYGKKKTALLPLTAKQFLQAGVFESPIDAPEPSAQLAELLDETGDASSESEDSPLSDAEPSEKIQTWSPVRKARVNKPVTEPPRAPLRRQKAIVISAVELNDGKHRRLALPVPDEVAGLHEVRPSDQPKRETGQQATSKPRQLAPKKRRRLPAANELQLVSNVDNSMLIDPISSSAHRLLDDDSSSGTVGPQVESKSRTSLSAIRRSLKAPLSRHKSLKELRRKQKGFSQTHMGTQSRQLLGDGFDGAELTFPIKSKISPPYKCRKRQSYQPISLGLQALSLTTGPLPHVDFLAPTYELKMESALDSAQKPQVYDDNEAYRVDAGSPVESASRSVHNKIKRAVSFSDQVRDLVASQLASISAPRRRMSQSSSSDGDSEDEESGDDSEPPEAAESYVDQADESDRDQDEPMPSDEEAMRMSQSASNQGQPSRRETMSPSLPPASPDDDVFVVQPTTKRGVSLDFRKPSVPGYSGRSLSMRRTRLIEVNEIISDEYGPDSEMLLDETPCPGARALQLGNMLPSSTYLNEPQDMISRPRSILKNSTPHIPQDTDCRPESTAANTRRNSRLVVEESRYFSDALDRLDESPLSRPQAQRVIRKKSSNYSHYNNDRVQVPYSGSMVVAETSPEPPDYSNYTDAGQLNVMRQTGDGTWTSSIAPAAAPRDLKTLTRSVSREHGTLSQAVRRRPSLPFQSPKIAR